jgi:uncharacterized membrane protein YhhN
MMPFPGGVSNASNGTLIFSALFALFYTFMIFRTPSRRRTIAKTGATLLLAMLAVLEGGPWLLIAALLLSAAGDAFLAYDGDRAFMAGLASFLAAHLAYIVLFLMIGGEAIGGWRLIAATLMTVFAAGFLVWLWNRVPGELRLSVAIYSAAILGMGLASLTVPNEVVALGAILFIASDAFLASGKFALAEDSPLRTPFAYAVWGLYYVAQALLTLSVLASVVRT